MRHIFILLLLFLSACGSALPTVKPFKLDIQQGNVVTSKMLLQLRPGMTKSQVRFIMGTPLVVDSFHKDRWDYFYQLRQAGKVVEQRRVILDFDKDLLSKVRGDVVPQGTPGAATGEENNVAKTITVAPKPKQEKGMLDKLKFWQKDELIIDAVKPATSLEAVTAAPATNSSAASGDAPLITDATPDVPSVLAVPVAGALTAELPAAETPKVEMPSVEAPKAEAEVAAAPVIAASPVEVPSVEAPSVPVTSAEVPPVAIVPAVEALAPTIEQAATAVTMPASKAPERLIFRLDRNLDLKNLQAPAEAAPTVNLKGDVNNGVVKPKKLEPPPPAAEPSFFDRMLEKIGF